MKLSFMELNSLCVLCVLCDLCGGFRFVSPHPGRLDQTTKTRNTLTHRENLKDGLQETSATRNSEEPEKTRSHIWRSRDHS
jgi:hypothetical protein